MNEVKTPKKPLIYYYGIVMLVLMLFNFLAMPWFAQHGLAGAWRAYQQDALGHRGTDLPVLVRVMEIIHNFSQILLGLILSPLHRVYRRDRRHWPETELGENGRQ